MAPGGPPPWVLETLGPDATDVVRIPWGFTNETWAGTDRDGARTVATRLASPGRAAALLARAPSIAARLAAAGLATPVPDERRSDPARGIVVSAWIEGVPGMQRLSEPDGPRSVGAAAGEAWRRLGAVAARGAALDDLWDRPAALARAAREWLAMASGDVSSAVAATAARRVADLPRLLEGRPGRFVHGDLVPANLLLRDGSTAAVLDLETVRLGDALFDPAWFRWIVRYHHPNAWRTAFTAFTDAAGGLVVGDKASQALLAALPTARILEILADRALETSARERWLSQLRAIADDDPGLDPP